jgi:2-dehydropantoate 2-reductase
MRVLVVGAGAIGSVIGGLLAEAGHDATLLGRPWHLDVVRRQGLAITGLWGERRVTQRLQLATRPDEVRCAPAFDWILVCVKSHQTAEAARLLPAWLGRATLVCAFQNGLGNYEILRAAASAPRVALARIIFGAELEPGAVRVTVCADDVLIGAPDPGFPRERIVQLAAALQESGIPSRTTASILVELWAKVLYNCALNGLSTVLEVPYGKLLEQDATRRVMGAVIEEAYRAAAAHRVPLAPSTAEAYRQLLFTRLIPDTAAHRSSMLQDVRRGRPTEIEALNGTIVRMAEQAGLTAPLNALITRLVHAKERFQGVEGQNRF